MISETVGTVGAIDTVIAGLVAIGVLVYLVYVLLNPERF